MEEETYWKFEVVWRQYRAEGEGDSEKIARMNCASNMLALATEEFKL